MHVLRPKRRVGSHERVKGESEVRRRRKEENLRLCTGVRDNDFFVNYQVAYETLKWGWKGTLGGSGGSEAVKRGVGGSVGSGGEGKLRALRILYARALPKRKEEIRTRWANLHFRMTGVTER
ncbi:hypothetical protein ABEB36_010463 [Hypothenemus hampei]|uniref:Uncharacterized protein n=1 Tax=Hypothenemus hampei TaxID=57062 RepID=A0ABD1EJT8_HYPHA